MNALTALLAFRSVHTTGHTAGRVAWNIIGLERYLQEGEKELVEVETNLGRVHVSRGMAAQLREEGRLQGDG